MKNLDLLVPSGPAIKGDVWTWATVTQVSPLRIRLDGDADALPITPEALFYGLALNQRVWVQLSGQRVIVHAPSGGASAAGSLDSLSDVTITSPTTGEVLRFNGSAWVDAALGISDVTNLQTTLNGKAASSHTHTSSDITDLGAVSLPTGAITMFGGGAAPSGYLLCNGQAVSRSTYSSLYSVIGTTYGAGNGSTTFNVPNLVNKFPYGGSNGATGGSANQTLSVDNLPAHTHSMAHDHDIGIEYSSNTTATGSSIRVTDIQNSTGGSGTNVTASTQNSNQANTGSTGTGTSFSIMPPYLGVTFIIKT